MHAYAFTCSAQATMRMPRPCLATHHAQCPHARPWRHAASVSRCRMPVLYSLVTRHAVCRRQGWSQAEARGRQLQRGAHGAPAAGRRRLALALALTPNLNPYPNAYLNPNPNPNPNLNPNRNPYPNPNPNPSPNQATRTSGRRGGASCLRSSGARSAWLGSGLGLGLGLTLILILILTLTLTLALTLTRSAGAWAAAASCW